MECHTVQRFTGLVISIDTWRCLNFVPIQGKENAPARPQLAGQCLVTPMHAAAESALTTI